MFLGDRCYTAENLEKDYLTEVSNYSDERWEALQRAARLVATVQCAVRQNGEPVVGCGSFR